MSTEEWFEFTEVALTEQTRCYYKLTLRISHVHDVTRIYTENVAHATTEAETEKGVSLPTATSTTTWWNEESYW